ncbi:glycosyltransferase family 4 protein [Patescibacteria group bacterium]|nr:glycosyltransferase family 4 protein [Patescibacteria group bacterium]
MTKISENAKNTPHLEGKKILYLVTQTKWGGAQKYVLQMAGYFKKHNEIHIAHGKSSTDDQRFLNSAKKLDIKTIELPYLVRNIDLSKDYLAMIDIYKLLNKEQYEIIHLNSSKTGLLGALAARLYASNPINTKIRVVYTAHGFVFNEPLSKTRKKLYRFSEKFSTAIQNVIITVSDYDKASAIENKITPDAKMITIHNGLDFDKYNFYEKKEALKKLSLNPDKKYFGTIASFYPTKGYQYLIEAIKMLLAKDSPIIKNYNWALIGDGPEMENIKKLAKDQGVENYIKFLGQIDNAYKYLPAFDIFVLPSVKEGLPFTILEAGLAQVPTIASRVGGISEIITDQKTGLLVSPADPLSLVESMEKMSSDNELANNIAHQNYQNIKNNFNLTNTLEKTEKIYLGLF